MAGRTQTLVKEQPARNGKATDAHLTKHRQSVARRALDEYTGVIRGLPGLEYGIFAIKGNLIKGIVVANHIPLDDRSRVSAAEMTIANRHPKLLWDIWLTDRKDTIFSDTAHAGQILINLAAPPK